MLDGKRDSAIKFPTAAQTRRSKDVYFRLLDEIQVNLQKTAFPAAEYAGFYTALVQNLQGLNKTNARYLGFFEQYFTMVRDLSANQGTQKDMELLKNHIPMALECIPFYVKRGYANECLKFAATKKPYDVLTKYLDYNREKWFLDILETVARNDPNAIKQYFGTGHPVNNVLKMSKDPVVLKLYEIYSEYGRSSSGFTNIDLVYNGKLSIEESENLAANPDKWYSTLCELRRKQNILGSYSVDDEIKEHSLKVVRKINLLHDEKDERIRFALAKNLSAEEIYNLIVYSRDEIFTSSFLGLFKRMMAKRKDSSLFVFFQKIEFNRFRTFIQTAAGYNSLQPMLNTMSAAEKDQLLDEIVKDLEKTGGNLAPAVEVADIYGSIADSSLRQLLAGKLKRELQRCFVAGNTYGARLYGLLYKLCGQNPNEITGSALRFDIPDLSRVEAGLLFPDGKNVQQHIYYDDEDGEAAYASFTAQFRTDKNYKVTEAADYVKIESVTGKKIVLYANKPKSETGLETLRKLYESQNRYPDIVVHRGHSYHLGTTIDQLTNNTKVAVLGSCGGYQNISRVLENATDAQIVSSKQIGTWTVNNVLLKDMNEMMRKGSGEIDWETLWKLLDPKLKNNDKWKDYIPPNQNLGVKFVKAFQGI
ncbi:MAG: hypothetical protein JNL57_08075 [Bacteroidetes bacterium]|nr:hypothetical protein [Bacteroidota bacterium]